MVWDGYENGRIKWDQSLIQASPEMLPPAEDVDKYRYLQLGITEGKSPWKTEF